MAESLESEMEAVSPPCPSSPPPPIIDWSADLQPLTLQVRRSLSSHTLLPSVADPDPGSGAFLTPGSGMNNPDHIF
jgi:hypothetical protein